MAITFGVATTAGTTSGFGRGGNGTFTVTLPTSWAAGQLCIILCYLDQGTATITTPATGWSVVSGAPWGSATPKLTAFYRFLVGGDGNPIITVAGSTGTLQAAAAAMTFNGVNTVTPIEVVGSASVGTGTPMTAGQINTLTNGAWVIGLCGRGDNETSSGQSFGGSTTGVTERLDAGNGVGDDGQVSAYSKEIASYGATGNGSATTSATDPWVSVLIALKPSVNTSLTVSEGSHGHTVDSVAVTQVHVLASNQATHGHSSDAISLTQVHNLLVSEASHFHIADSPVLEEQGNDILLVVEEGQHGHASDSPILTQLHNLMVQESLHGQIVDAISLIQAHQLSVQGILHGHLSDNVFLTQVHYLIVSGAEHLHTVDNVILDILIRSDTLIRIYLGNSVRSAIEKGIEDFNLNYVNDKNLSGININVLNNCAIFRLDDLSVPGGFGGDSFQSSATTNLSALSAGMTKTGFSIPVGAIENLWTWIKNIFKACIKNMSKTWAWIKDIF